MIELSCSNEVAKRSNDRMNLVKVTEPAVLSGTASVDTLTDIIYYEIQTKQDVDLLKDLRKRESAALLMLLTSAKVSPMLYLKPGISPDHLLLRPFSRTMFDEVNAELFDAYEASCAEEGGEGSFTVNTREGKTLIPYEKILFFEAANKKINVRVGAEEYDFYDSIDNIATALPDYFQRSHRAYLVNTRKIRKIKLTEGIIELEGGVIAPLSRSYRAEFKKY